VILSYSTIRSVFFDRQAVAAPVVNKGGSIGQVGRDEASTALSGDPLVACSRSPESAADDDTSRSDSRPFTGVPRAGEGLFGECPNLLGVVDDLHFPVFL